MGSGTRNGHSAEVSGRKPQERITRDASIDDPTPLWYQVGAGVSYLTTRSLWGTKP